MFERILFWRRNRILDFGANTEPTDADDAVLESPSAHHDGWEFELLDFNEVCVLDSLATRQILKTYEEGDWRSVLRHVCGRDTLDSRRDALADWRRLPLRLDHWKATIIVQMT